MSRYFYYLIVLNMLANVVALVPRILIDNRFDGTIISIMIGSFLSLIFLYFFTNIMMKFPGKGQPEIVIESTPKWFYRPYLFFISILYFIAAWLILLTFIDITKRFINPEMSTLLTLLLFLSIVSFGALMKTEKTLYALEIVLIISIPLIFAIFFKSFFNKYLSWDAIKIVLTHSIDRPSLETIGAASYSFIGFYYISIYNRVFKHRRKKVSIFLVFFVAVVGIINIFISLMIPIGFNGADGVGEYIYPWFSTADSIRIEFGFIERVLFIFLLLYIGISIISATISCHTGLETIKSILPNVKWKKHSIMPFIVLLAFSILTIVSHYALTQVEIYQIAKYYFIFLIPVGFVSISVLFWSIRRLNKR